MGIVNSKIETEDTDIPVQEESYRLWLIRVIQTCIFLIPLLYYKGAADPFLSPRFFVWSIICLILFMILADQRTGAGKRAHGRAHLDSALICLAMLLIVSSISLFQVVNIGEGVNQWLKSFLFFSFLYGVKSTLGGHPRLVPCLIRSVIISGVLFATVGLFQILGLYFMDIPGYFRPRGTMGNANLFASALFLYLPFVLYGITHFEGAWRNVSVISALLIGANIMATGTRSVFLAVGGSGAIVYFLSLRCRRNGRCVRSASGSSTLWRKWFAVALFLCCIFSSLLFIHLSNGGGRFLRSFDSMKERIILWEKTLQMARTAPIFGIGPGQWKIHLPAQGRIEKQYESNGLRYEVIFQRPHNDFLWTLAETGVSGLLCMLGFFGFLVLRCHYLMKFSQEISTRRLGTFLLFGLLGFMAISVFSFPKERIFHNVFLSLIAGIILSTYQWSFGKRNDIEPETGKWFNGVILVLCAVSVIFSYGRLRSDIHTREALDARNAGRWEQVIEYVGQSIAWYYTLDPESVPLLWYRAMAYYQMGRVDMARIDFQNACAVHPFHNHSLNNAATINALAGNWEAAKYYINLQSKIHNHDILIN